MTSNAKGRDVLKRFLVWSSFTGKGSRANKRDNIAFPKKMDNRIIDDIIKNVDLDLLTDALTHKRSSSPHYLKRNPKTFVKVERNSKNGKVGITFATTDAKVATVEKANKALAVTKTIIDMADNSQRKPSVTKKEPYIGHLDNTSQASVRQISTKNNSITGSRNNESMNSKIFKKSNTLLNTLTKARKAFAASKKVIDEEQVNIKRKSSVALDVAAKSSILPETGLTHISKEPTKHEKIAEEEVVTTHITKEQSIGKGLTHITKESSSPTDDKTVTNAEKKSEEVSDVLASLADDENAPKNIESGKAESGSAEIALQPDRRVFVTDRKNSSLTVKKTKTAMVVSQDNNVNHVQQTNITSSNESSTANSNTSTAGESTVNKAENKTKEAEKIQVNLDEKKENITEPASSPEGNKRDTNTDIPVNSTTTTDSNTAESDKHRLEDTEAETLKRQKETIQRLKEAKAAHQRYEVAKQELAEKVKELYILANQFEKDDTNDQILEVKNFISKNQEKRDEEGHPGVALSSVRSHPSNSISTESTDGEPKGFTLGALDKSTHEVAIHPDPPAARVEKVYDLGLPGGVKVDDFSSALSSTRKTETKAENPQEEETLKVLAEAIKQDMDEISKNEKEKKIITSVTSSFSALPKHTPETETSHTESTKSESQDATKKEGKMEMDDYLTKALNEILQDSNTTTGISKENQEKPSKQKAKENLEIVKEALAKHVKNPNAPLPLLKTTGDKITQNTEPAEPASPEDAKKADEKKKEENKVKDRSQENKAKESAEHKDSSASDIQKVVSDLHDPVNKLLLEKASHMEEQVASAQDKLYNKQMEQQGVSVATQAAVQPSAAEPAAAKNVLQDQLRSGLVKDPYGSIKEETTQPGGTIEDAESDRSAVEAAGEEDEEEDDEPPPPRRRHHRHRHSDAYDRDEEEDDDGNEVRICLFFCESSNS